MFGAVSGAERGLGGRGGHKYAAGILSGGSGKAFAGHGKYVFGSGDFWVPDGPVDLLNWVIGLVWRRLQKLIRDLQVILKAWLLICRVLRFLTIL